MLFPSSKDNLTTDGLFKSFGEMYKNLNEGDGYKTSEILLSLRGNHFLTLLFDEPQQQSASTLSFKEFLKELQKYRDEQVIVLASFQNSEEDYKEATEDLVNFNVIDLASTDELMIQRVQ